MLPIVPLSIRRQSSGGHCDLMGPRCWKLGRCKRYGPAVSSGGTTEVTLLSVATGSGISPQSPPPNDPAVVVVDSARFPFLIRLLHHMFWRCWRQGRPRQQWDSGGCPPTPNRRLPLLPSACSPSPMGTMCHLSGYPSGASGDQNRGAQSEPGGRPSTPLSGSRFLPVLFSCLMRFGRAGRLPQPKIIRDLSQRQGLAGQPASNIQMTPGETWGE